MLQRVGEARRRDLRQGTQRKVVSVASRWQLKLFDQLQVPNPISRVRMQERLPLENLGDQFRDDCF